MSGKYLKREKPLEDFLPQWGAERKSGQQTPQQMYDNFVSIFNFAKAKAELKKLES